MIKIKINKDLIIILLVILLAACAGGQTAAPAATQLLPTAIPPTQTEPPAPPTATAASLPTATPVPPTATATLPPVIPALPAEPQAIEFAAADGQALKGTYFPAVVNTAPVVVLMHWAGGDEQDWTEIAFWLQNRGLGGASPNPQNAPWLDSSWFPTVPEGVSYAVFTFTFRGFDKPGAKFDRAGWLLDAQAAMQTASGLEGVDPQKVAAIGASIGADGAADGCAWLNQQGAGSCPGALSLSPGDYLTLKYADVVKTLGENQPPVPAWCLFSSQDGESMLACDNVIGKNYTKVEYPGNAHGMFLLVPDKDPNAMQLILDFLKDIFAG